MINKKLYQKIYRQKSIKIICEICLGNYKQIDKSKHWKTKKHKYCNDFKNSFNYI